MIEDDIVIVKTHKKRGSRIAIAVLLGVAAGVLTMKILPATSSIIIFPEQRTGLWDVQSVDTVKSSRDLSREKAHDPLFDATIEEQVVRVASLGATHIALGTPYDEEFVPMLGRWVRAAREHGLKVWFRGNFSGWEGWFDYPQMNQFEHRIKTTQFIKSHPDLFEDGDIFTSCTECENGALGDPRKTGDVDGFQSFLVEEYRVTREAFEDIGKAVRSNYYPMNGDVARLVMDKETTRALGGVVVVDHYVASPAKLVRDLELLRDQSGGDVVLGEFGAPIPDIHGSMTEAQQAAWLDEVLEALASVRRLRGVNYWVSEGGSTALWRETGEERSAAGILRTYYSPHTVVGVVSNELGSPIGRAVIENGERSVIADALGFFTFPSVGPAEERLRVSAPGYLPRDVALQAEEESAAITLIREHKDPVFYLRELLQRLGITREQVRVTP